MSDDLKTALAAIRLSADLATEGPWVDGMGTHGNPADGPEFCEVRTVPTDERTRGITIAELDLVEAAAQDAEFIAHARTDVPRLVTALEAVVEHLDEVVNEKVNYDRMEGYEIHEHDAEVDMAHALIDDIRVALLPLTVEGEDQHDG